MIVLSLVFFAAGCGMFFAAWWHARVARRHRQLFDALQRHAAECADPLDWPRQAADVLAQAGIVTLAWQGHWFGQPIQGRIGRDAANAPWQETLSEGPDVALSVKAGCRSRQGEERWLAEQVWQLFLLHWRMQIREREKSLDAALVQRAEHALKLKHDLRNFAQWVSWTVGEFAAARDDAELLAAARRLARQAEAASARAQSLVARSAQAAPTATAPLADLPGFIDAAARFHGLTLAFCGAASTRSASDVWLIVLDNLFSNLGREMRQQGVAAPVPIRLEERDGRAVCHIGLPEGLAFSLPVERLFEPFASGRPGGLGLGLYLARRAAIAAGGALAALADPPGFILELP